MSAVAISAVLFAVLVVLLLGGVWIAIAMGAVAWLGLQLFTSSPPEVNLFQSFWGSNASWTLAALPLFVWMGEILFRTRLSDEMFEGLAPWIGWLPGRLMHVNIFGCGIFAAVSGSSSATCATIAKVALPELIKRGYDEKTCLGSLCGAGTLGLLIPPSIIMIVYAVAAEVSILKMFVAGVLPGAMLVLFFSGYIVVWALLNPEKTPQHRDELSFVERIHRARNLIPCLILIAFVMGAMFTGYATATEAAAFGVLGALAIAGWSGSLTAANLWASLMGATRLSCMILFILAGAAFLSSCMAFTGIPRALAEWVTSLGASPYALIAVLALVYLVLGTALDGISMIVLTTSIVLPMVEAAGFDLIWFGIFIVLLVEIAELTPPLGFNLFVLQTMSGRDSNYVALASIPFFCMMVLALFVVIAFPQIATWLPEALLGVTPEMTQRLAGKVAFITGAGAGIGRATARLFAREGASVVVADIAVAAAEETAELAGNGAIAMRTDVTDEASVRAAIAATLERFGRLDVLHNNAGGSTPQDGTVVDAPLEEFWRVIRLDLFGTFLGCRVGIPALIRSGGGAVINMSSNLAFMGIHGRDCYTAAKGGVAALTRSLAVEFAPQRVRVNALAPSATMTERVKKLMAGNPALDKLAQSHLLGLIQPEDVAAAALYLASDESRMVTGQVLPVDSGVTIS